MFARWIARGWDLWSCFIWYVLSLCCVFIYIIVECTFHYFGDLKLHPFLFSYEACEGSRSKVPEVRSSADFSRVAQRQAARNIAIISARGSAARSRRRCAECSASSLKGGWTARLGDLDDATPVVCFATEKCPNGPSTMSCCFQWCFLLTIQSLQFSDERRSHPALVSPSFTNPSRVMVMIHLGWLLQTFIVVQYIYILCVCVFGDICSICVAIHDRCTPTNGSPTSKSMGITCLKHA